MENVEKKALIHVCRGKKCTRRGATELSENLSRAFAAQGVEVAVSRHDCFDLCKQACNLLLELPGQEQRIYTGLHPSRAEAFAQHIAEELGAERLVPG